ncbi:hypothetical protein ACB094_09G004600 [Castanea mollissima]
MHYWNNHERERLYTTLATDKIVVNCDERLLIFSTILLAINTSKHPNQNQLHLLWKPHRKHIKPSSFRENLLLATAKTKSAPVLNVIISESPPILQFLTSQGQPLPTRRDFLLVWNLRLHIIDRIRTLHFQSNLVPSRSLDEYLHTSTGPQHRRQSRFLLNMQSRSVTNLIRGDGPIVF